MYTPGRAGGRPGIGERSFPDPIFLPPFPPFEILLFPSSFGPTGEEEEEEEEEAEEEEGVSSEVRGGGDRGSNKVKKEEVCAHTSFLFLGGRRYMVRQRLFFF